MKKPKPPTPKNKPWKQKPDITPCLVQQGVPYVLCHRNERNVCMNMYIHVYMKEVLQDRGDLEQDPEVEWDYFGKIFWRMILVGSPVVVLNSCRTSVKQEFDLPDKLSVVEDGYSGLILEISIRALRNVQVSLVHIQVCPPWSSSTTCSISSDFLLWRMSMDCIVLLVVSVPSVDLLMSIFCTSYPRAASDCGTSLTGMLAFKALCFVVTIILGMWYTVMCNSFWWNLSANLQAGRSYFMLFSDHMG